MGPRFSSNGPRQDPRPSLHTFPGSYSPQAWPHERRCAEENIPNGELKMGDDLEEEEEVCLISALRFDEILQFGDHLELFEKSRAFLLTSATPMLRVLQFCP